MIEQVHTPYLDEIARVGGYTRAYVGGEKGAYSETPTISAVGYNSLLTGTWVNKHNAWGNEIKAPNYHYWTIFRFMEEQYPEKQTAIFSTWLDNRTKLIGEGLPQTGVTLDYHLDGFENDTVQFPHTTDKKFIHQIDEHVAREAARYVKARGPDLSWVYLQYTDDMGHQFGDSQPMYDAVAGADEQVGRIWKAIRYREQHYAEDWLILITTDHGRDEKTGKHHGGQSERERATWMVTNAKNLNGYFKAEEPGIVAVFPTLTRFLGLEIPTARAREIDGVPLIGAVSLADPRASYRKGNIKLSWKALEASGKVKVWVSTTNHFATGGKDEYHLVGEAPLDEETFRFEIQDPPTSLHKIVLEAPHNRVNTWVVLENHDTKP